MYKMTKRLLVFDFDGVLGIKWTMPEEYFPQIPQLLEQLAKDNLLCVASYNPRAELAIKSWGLDKHFVCMRSGANHVWNDIYEESHRVDLSKAVQIINMIENEIKELEDHQQTEVVFFDDDPVNIKLVNEKLPNVKTVLIDGDVGLNLEDIPI